MLKGLTRQNPGHEPFGVMKKFEHVFTVKKMAFQKSSIGTFLMQSSSTGVLLNWPPQPILSAIIFVCSMFQSRFSAHPFSMEPLDRITFWKRSKKTATLFLSDQFWLVPRVCLEMAIALELDPPAEFPVIVMSFGFPPNSAMLSTTNLSPIAWSQKPRFPAKSGCPFDKKPEGVLFLSHKNGAKKSEKLFNVPKKPMRYSIITRMIRWLTTRLINGCFG